MTGARDHEFDDPLDGASSPDLEPEPAPRRPPADLKEKTARSIIWTIIRTGSDYILSFAVFAVLARKLGPEAFGVFALAVAFADFGRILPAAGLATAIQRARRVTPAMADTVFWTSLAVSVLAAGVLALLAGPIADAFGEPTVAPLLTSLGVIPGHHDGGGDPHRAHAPGVRPPGDGHPVGGEQSGGRRGGARGRGRRLGRLEPGGAARCDGGGGDGDGLARIPVDARETIFVRRAPGAGRFQRQHDPYQILFVALVRVQDVIIGRTIGTVAVGVYRTAWRTVELIAQSMIMPFSQVALPTLGRLQDDLPAFRKAYLRIIAVSSALAFPAIIGFAVLAPHAIPFIFGGQWEESARIARLLGLMAVPFTLNRFAGPALATLGRSGLLARSPGSNWR